MFPLILERGIASMLLRVRLLPRHVNHVLVLPLQNALEWLA